MKMKKLLALMMIGVMLVVGLTGCKEDSGETADGKTKLSYWKVLNVNTGTIVSNLGETEFAKKWQEMGNVEVEFLHPPAGQQAEKFGVMTASDDMPDIIEYNWVDGYPGGPGAAIRDGVIIDISQYKEYAPNLFKYLEQEENAKKAKLCRTPEGEYFGFPTIMNDPRLAVSSGLAIRYDWLEELGLPIPETIDDWTQTLRAFRDKKGAEAAYQLMVDWYPFALAYGVDTTWYLDGDTVKYGRAEEGFKKCLELLNSWYNEGLISKEFSTLDSKSRDYAILNGLSGACLTNMGGGIGKYMAATTDPNFELGPAPFPVLNKGDEIEYGYKQQEVSGSFAAITTSCKDIEAAMRFLDMAYAPESEAYMLCNFGIEGESYEMIDGYPTYTDVVVNNPEGRSMAEAMGMYMTSFTAGPYIQDYRYFEQYAKLPQQKEAIQVWSAHNGDAHLLPYIYVEKDELDDSIRLSNDINTYAKEMTLKFIMGTEPLSKFDDYVAELNQRGLSRLQEIKQRAYDRYCAN